MPKDKTKNKKQKKQKHNVTKPMGCSKSSSKRKIHSDPGVPDKQEKSQSNVRPKGTRKRRTNEA